MPILDSGAIRQALHIHLGAERASERCKGYQLYPTLKYLLIHWDQFVSARLSQPIRISVLLTSAQVCAALNVSSSWLARRRGELGAIVFGGRSGKEYRYPQEKIEEYKLRNTVHPAQSFAVTGRRTLASITADIMSRRGQTAAK